MRILKAMQEKQRFSPTEQNIIDYLMAHSAEAVELSIRELAEKTFSSTAAIIRLCRKFNLSGYNEFKLKFAAEISRTEGGNCSFRIHRPINNADSLSSVIRKMAALEIEAIEETKNELDEAQILAIAQKMKAAKIVGLYAFDQNHYLAQAAAYNLLQANCLTVCYDALNSQICQALGSDKNQLALIISRTGENRRLIEVMKILKKRGTHMVAITSAPKTTIARLADEYIYVANTYNYLDMGGMVFSVGVRYIFDMLFGALMYLDYDGEEAFIAEFEKVMGATPEQPRLW